MGENLKTHTFYCSLDATSKSCSVVSSQLHTVSIGFFLRLTREEVYTFSWALVAKTTASRTLRLSFDSFRSVLDD